jgi:hypothetical protein
MKVEKKYLDFSPSKGYPAGPDLNYECTICGCVIPSIPDDNIGCDCGNVFIDIDAGRISIKNDKEVKLFSSENSTKIQ